MEDLINKLQALTPNELDFVMARSSNNSVKEACKEAGISQSTLYGWENREELEEIAFALRLDRHVEVELKLREALPAAVEVIIEGLKERKYDTKFKAAVEILDRTMGKATQKIDQKTELTGANGEPLLNDDRYDRALSKLAAALRESVPDQGTGTEGAVGTAE